MLDRPLLTKLLPGSLLLALAAVSGCECVSVAEELTLEARVCGAAADGYLVLCASDRYHLAKVDKDAVIELARVELEPAADPDAPFARDPSTGSLWLAEPSGQLHAFSSSGAALELVDLGFPSTRRLMQIAAGEGALVVSSATLDGSGVVVSRQLERYTSAGELGWSLDYASLGEGGFEVDILHPEVVGDGLFIALAEDVLFDSASFEILALELDSGAIAWRHPVVIDNFGGPAVALSHDEDHIYLSELDSGTRDDLSLEWTSDATATLTTLARATGELRWSKSETVEDMRRASRVSATVVGRRVVERLEGDDGSSGFDGRMVSLRSNPIDSGGSCSSALDPELDTGSAFVSVSNKRAWLGGSSGASSPPRGLILKICASC